MRWVGIVAAIITATVDVLYLGFVNTQGASDPEFLRVPFVAAFIALMAICAALSARASAVGWRPLLLGVSAAGLLLLGYFAIFSIGLPLLVAGRWLSSASSIHSAMCGCPTTPPARQRLAQWRWALL